MAGEGIQTENYQRRVGVMNSALLVLVAAVAGSALVWALLYYLYRIDRSDAGAMVGASMTVLMIVPPLMSYLMALELTKKLALRWQVLLVYGLALVWIVVQRNVIYPAFGLRPEIGENVANFLLLPAFGIACWLGVRSFRYRKRLQQAVALQEQSEMRLLEAQLAPHMLFNMLNTVYAVLLTDPARAVPLFLSMSEMLRHVVSRTQKTWIPLHEELDFLEHFTALEKARNEQARIAVRTEGDLDVPVPPMLLATLFENAVKHGRLVDGRLDIEVTVNVSDDELAFHVTNSCSPSRVQGNGMGLGLANVRRRLALLYPDRHEFNISADGDRHTAVIRIRP